MKANIYNAKSSACVKTVVFLLLCSCFLISAGAQIINSGIDEDGDGVFDEFDLDDDNDGILDVDEYVMSQGGTPVTPLVNTTRSIPPGMAEYDTLYYLSFDSAGHFLDHRLSISSIDAAANVGFRRGQTDTANNGDVAFYFTNNSRDTSFTVDHSITSRDASRVRRFRWGIWDYLEAGTNIPGPDIVVTWPPGITATLVQGAMGGVTNLMNGAMVSSGDTLRLATGGAATYDFYLEFDFAVPVSSFQFSHENVNDDGRQVRIDLFAFSVDISNSADTDMDGISDILDTDSDGDGCPDADEAYNMQGIADMWDGSVNMFGLVIDAGIDGTGMAYTNAINMTGQGQPTHRQGVVIAAMPPLADMSVDEGQIVSFSATLNAPIMPPVAPGTNNMITYQWQRSIDNGATFTDIMGETGTVASGTMLTLTLPAVNLVDSGDQFRILATTEANTCVLPIDTAILSVSNVAPMAADDRVSTAEENSVDTAILDNDIDPGPLDSTSVSIVTGSAFGTAVLNPTSLILTYTPDVDFIGLDTVEYRVCDKGGPMSPPLCDTAFVIIRVNGEIDTLQEDVLNDSTFMVCDTALIGGAQGESIAICDVATLGAAMAMGTCVTYTPMMGGVGEDTFCIEVCNDGICDTTIVTLTIVNFLTLPPNDTVLCDFMPMDTSAGVLGSAMVTSTCDVAGTALSSRDTIVKGLCTDTILRIWTGSDMCSRIDVDTQFIFVIDTVFPSFLMSAGDTLRRDTLTCASDTNDLNLTVADIEALLRGQVDVSTQNCGDDFDSLWVVGPTDLGAASCPNHFERSIFLALGDSCAGWTDTLVHYLYVEDTLGPVFTSMSDTLRDTFACASDTLMVDEVANQMRGMVDTMDSHCNDYYDTVIVETTSGSCLNKFTRAVSLIISDSCNMNSDTLVWFTTVNDSVGPMFTAMSDTLRDTFACASDTLTVDDVANQMRSMVDTMDSHCNDYYDTVIVDLTPGSCPNQFTRSVSLIISDSCHANSDTLVWFTEVMDTFAPSFTLTNGAILSNDTLVDEIGCINDTIAAVDFNVSLVTGLMGNCGDDSVYLLSNVIDSTSAEICPLNFRRHVTYVAVDGCGNADTIVFQTDVEGPDPSGLGPDREGCHASWTFTSGGTDACDIRGYSWTVVQGQGSINDMGVERAEYCPVGPEEIGDTVLIALNLEPRNTSCDDVSDTVQIIIEAPCFNAYATIDVSCGDSVTVQDLLTRQVDSCLSEVFEVELFTNVNNVTNNASRSTSRVSSDNWRENLGPRLSNPVPKTFTGDFWAIVTSTWTGARTITSASVQESFGCRVINNLDTTLWCIDEFLEADPNSSFYQDTLIIPPLCIDDCTGDTLGFANYEGEWETSYECGDTLSEIVRGWYWENKNGSRCYGYDTLMLIRLPQISEVLYAPQKDTIICMLDTVYDSTEVYGEVCWKQLVGIHSDGTMIYYPVDETDEATGSEVLIVREDGYVERVDSITSNYGVVSYRGKDSYEVEIFEGDRVLSNGGAFIEVDANWFYEGIEHGFWIDLCVPSVDYVIDTVVCDVWEESCSGVEVILPNHPYTPDTCSRFCLNELASENACVEVVFVDETASLGGSCPEVRKRLTTIKQNCFASGVASLAGLGASCPLDTNTSGVTRIDSMNGGLFIDVEQWIIYEDTIAPLSPGQSLEFSYTSDAKSCSGDVEIPEIAAKDLCSGVKSVKATLTFGGQEIGLGWVELSDEDGDGLWSQAEGGRRLRMACGDEYEVRYELMDSCHNEVIIDRHELRMEDRVAPTVITDDTLRLSLGGVTARMEAERFTSMSSDNCGIRQILVRRGDSTRCGEIEDYKIYGVDDVCYEALDSFDILGGGWSEEVSFCCTDVCEDVVVEVLVIDKSCNYTKGWVVVQVEDKSSVEVAMEFDTLSIGCSSYGDRYGSLLDVAAGGDEAALDSLDELLGSLVRGSRSEDNRLLDATGAEINKDFSYVTSTCSTEVIERKVLDTAHDGQLMWNVVEEERNVLYETEEEAQVGGVFVRCGSRVDRDVWLDIDECGQGRVVRRWLVYGGCGEDHELEPTILEQVINVVSDCALSEASFIVPDDTVVCGDLMYDMSGNVELDVDELIYGLGDLECRELGIGYEDEILRIVGDADRRKVYRTWNVKDWCSGEELDFVQKIVVDMSCANNNAVEFGEQEASRGHDDARSNFQLYQNRPNPFIDQSSIRFRLPETTRAKLTFFDASGRILHVMDKQYGAGVHEEVITIDELGARIGGVIYYQLDTETHSATKQMVRLK